jgi:hypothetical protein
MFSVALKVECGKYVAEHEHATLAAHLRVLGGVEE